MIPVVPVALLSLLVATGTVAADSTCQFEKVPVGAQKLGAWIDKSNWLTVENQRVTLQVSEVFMPTWHLGPSGQRQLEFAKRSSVDDFPADDPLDDSRRSLGFLLDSRLYADGLVVLRNGRIVAERYRNGLVPDKPRLLRDVTRPLLNLLGAMSVGQGKLSPDKSVIRYLPGMSTSTGLRKVSIQRLLQNEEHLAWTPEELDAWRQASGWNANPTGNNIRAWLSHPGRWDRSLGEQVAPVFGSSPEDDLLAWALAESNAMPLSQLFCKQLLSRMHTEHDILWASDSLGVELASGLGLSLRDFSSLGQLLVEARSGRSRAKIPGWFIETLAASKGVRSSGIEGLSNGSERRYGFVHLGGPRNRVALIGAHGTSLYIDFDKRLVIALYATRPGENTRETLALLEQVWKAIDRATALPKN